MHAFLFINTLDFDFVYLHIHIYYTAVLSFFLVINVKKFSTNSTIKYMLFISFK